MKRCFLRERVWIDRDVSHDFESDTLLTQWSTQLAEDLPRHLSRQTLLGYLGKTLTDSPAPTSSELRLHS